MQTKKLQTLLAYAVRQLVSNRNGSRASLIEALDKTEERLVIVCPWLCKHAIDSGLLQKFVETLKRGACIHIGWGYLGDTGFHKQKTVSRSELISKKSWKYDALPELEKLERCFSSQFKLRLLGTHEKFFLSEVPPYK